MSVSKAGRSRSPILTAAIHLALIMASVRGAAADPLNQVDLAAAGSTAEPYTGHEVKPREVTAEWDPSGDEVRLRPKKNRLRVIASDAFRRLQHFENTKLDPLLSWMGEWTVQVNGGMSVGIPFIGSAIGTVDLTGAGSKSKVPSHTNASAQFGSLFLWLTSFARKPPTRKVVNDAAEPPVAGPPRGIRPIFKWVLKGDAYRWVRQWAYASLVLGGWGFATPHPIHGTSFVWFGIPHLGSFSIGRSGGRGLIGFSFVTNPISMVSPTFAITVSHPSLPGPKIVRGWIDKLAGMHHTAMTAVKEVSRAQLGRLKGAWAAASGRHKHIDHRRPSLPRMPVRNTILAHQ